MSKDFGVAGIRAGYAVMAPRPGAGTARRMDSCGIHPAWPSISIDLYSRPDFQIQYERERIRFIRNSRRFFAALAKIDGLRVYPTFANFALVELRGGLSADELVCRLLIRRGIYTRTCDDKKGLEAGKFVRIAARNRPENAYIIRSLRRLIG